MHFQILRKDQKELVIGWLGQDYVAKYWYGKGLQNTLKTIDQFVNDQETIFTCWIAYDGKTPFGFLLTSKVNLKEDHLYAKYCKEGSNAITLDLLIGNLTFLGKGFASIMIQQLLAQKYSSVTDVFIDPNIENKKAIHVYEKIGFQKREEFIPEWDPNSIHLLMQLSKIVY